MKAVAFFVLIAICPGSAWAQDDIDGVPPEGHPMGVAGGYCGTAHPQPGAASLAGNAALTSNVIFVNRCTGGCSYTGALQHDAVNNKIAIRGTANGTTYNFLEFKNFAGQSGTAADAEWNDLVSCIRKVYSYYNTTVVTTRPTSGTYHMMHISGKDTDLGFPAQPQGVLLGISDVVCSGAIDNMTSFTFAENHKIGSISTSAAQYVKNLCVTSTHEAGHSYGLEHEFKYFDNTSACTDPMSYDTGACDPPYRFFRNKLAKCGGFEEGPCACTTGMQNSHVRLFALFGAGTPMIATPSGNIINPAPDGQVGRTVIGSIGHERGIERVDVYLNGWKWGSMPGAPFEVGAGQDNPAIYNWVIPDSVPDSKLDIYMRAFDDLENFIDTPVVTAVKGAPCANADTCNEGQKCEDGKCFWDAPVGEVGDECSYNEYCTTNKCVGSDGNQVCSRTCVIGATGACPEGLECRKDEAGESLCFRPEGGGCCSASDEDMPWAAGLSMFVLGMLILRRRRHA